MMPTTKSCRRRLGIARRSWIIVCVLVLVGLIWFAPTLIGSSFKHKLGKWALPDYEGEIEIGTARLGWMSPILLRDITARDKEGDQFLSVDEIKGNRSLFSLLLNRKDLGRFRVKKPELHIQVQDKTSNLEEVLSSLKQDTKKKDNSIDVEVSIEIKKGSVLITDVATDREWKIEPLKLKLKTDPAGDLGFELEGSATVTNDSQQSGKITAETEKDDVVLNLDSVPIDLLEPFLHREVSDAKLGGIVSGQLSCRPSDDDEETNVRASGNISVENFQLESSEKLGQDVLELATFTADAQLRINSDQLIVDSLKITTDVGEIATQVTIDLSVEDADLADLLGDEDCAIKATVHLAKLAELIPDTLGIRENTTIKSGEVTLHFTSHQAEAGREWSGQLDSTHLEGTANGQPISWQQPITAIFKAHESDSGTMIDELTCQSEFLRVDGKGTLDAASFTANCDLNRLVDQLGQFIDLEELQLSGTATGDLQWNREKDDRLTVTGKALVQDFELRDAEAARSWTEPQLRITLTAHGSATDKQVERIDDAEFLLEADTDRLVVKLTQPVDTSNDEAEWPLEINVKGDLATWVPRLSPVADVMDWDVRGSLNGSFAVTVGSTKTDISEGSLELKSLEAHKDSLHIVEPEMQWSVTGSWDSDEETFRSDSITMTSTSASLRAKDFAVRMNEGDTPAIDGELAIRGDLSKLTKWLEDPDEEATQRLSGAVTGDVELTHANDVTHAKWDAKIVKLAIQRRTTSDSRSGPGRTVSRSESWEELWSEDEVRLNGQGIIDHEENTFRLEEVVLNSELLAISASGTVTDLDGAGNVDIKGQADYDMEDVVQAMKGYLGEGFQLVGQQRQAFSIQGPLDNESSSDGGSGESLVSDGLVATGGLGWESGDVYGLVLGPANVQARLADQRMQFDPIDLAVNDGRLRIQPEILLEQDPPLLMVPQGRILDHVSITREMCADWLKFVAPLLADATRIDGQLSIDLDHAKIVLGDMDSSDVRGSATIHSGEIRPGPLLNRVVPLVTRVRSIFRRKPLAGLDPDDPRLTTTEQQMQFRLKDGRVYHDNLKMRLGDIDVFSSGSVGLDESLNITVELHIPKSWAREDRLLSKWGGKVIEIPIRGTLDDPDIDDSVLANIAIEAIPDVINNVIDSGLIRRGLNRLFDRRN